MTNTGWTTNHTILRNTMAQLYLDKASAQRVITDVGINPAFITFSDNATNNWHEIIKKADDLGLLIPLIEQASNEFPKNEVLKKSLAVFKETKVSSEAIGVSPMNMKQFSDPQLRDFIKEQFNKRDIADMLDDLTATLQQAHKISSSTTVDIDTFSSTTEPIGSIAREMVQYFKRRTWTPFLVDAVQAARPDAFRDKFGE